MVFTIVSTDWTMLAQSVVGIDKIARERCRQAAEREALNLHGKHNHASQNAKLTRF
jgi:hypothetical protein